MKTRFRFLMYVLFALAITMTSCEKEGQQGPIGPAGAQGQQGIAGPEGPAGADGADGADGVAQGVPGPQGEAGPAGPQGEAGPAGNDGADGTNGVDGADGADGTNGADGEDGNANVIASPWIPEEFDDTPSTFSSFSVTDSNLTSEIANNAAILVYGKAGSVTVGLPYTRFSDTYFYGIDPSLNEIFFAGASLDNSRSTYSRFSDFRYVIIPAANTSGKSVAPDYSKMSYEEVMDLFGLEY